MIVIVIVKVIISHSSSNSNSDSNSSKTSNSDRRPGPHGRREGMAALSDACFECPPFKFGRRAVQSGEVRRCSFGLTRSESGLVAVVSNGRGGKVKPGGRTCDDLHRDDIIMWPQATGVP